jgi:hypothetical protein
MAQPDPGCEKTLMEMFKIYERNDGPSFRYADLTLSMDLFRMSPKEEIEYDLDNWPYDLFNDFYNDFIIEGMTAGAP